MNERRTLHERSLLGEQEVVLSLVDKIPAGIVRLDQDVRAHRTDQKLWTLERDVKEDVLL